MSAPAWFSALAARDQSRQALLEPHSIVIEGWAWSLATNGHRLVLLPVDYGFAPFKSGLADRVRSMLAAKTPAVPLDLVKLRHFLGDVVPKVADCMTCVGGGKVPCEKCDGVGKGTCECTSCNNVHDLNCGQCLGDGVEVCHACGGANGENRIPVTLNGMLLNAQLLANPAEILAGETASLQVGEYGEPAIIRGDGWTLLVMGLRDTEKAIAHFRTDAAQAVA